MAGKFKCFRPDWEDEEPPAGSYRSIFKWGAADKFKNPNERLYKMMKEVFKLTDQDFVNKQQEGLEKVELNTEISLTPEQVNTFKQIVGPDNVKQDGYSRLKVAYGKTMYDLMRLREKIIENLPDLVIYPRNKDDLIQIVNYCSQEKIPLYVFGGGSSVTRGVECVKGGISLDISIHLNQVIEFNQTDQTITVQAGISGPELEKQLNQAPELFNAGFRYTCGHFPQSFEYSVVGGWVVTRGAGQNSTYYGKIEDLVISQEYVTPQGIIKTGNYPACATGPSIDEIMLGSEGAYGILVNVTLKVFKSLPANNQRFAYIFKNWNDARQAAREIMQGQFGFPSIFRFSDPEETDVGLKLYGIEGTILDKLMNWRGYKSGERCLFLGMAEGEKSFAKNIKKKTAKICKKHGGMYLTGLATKAWEKGRFNDPYLRDSLQDFAIITDTLECAVSWKNLDRVYQGVRDFCKKRDATICMTHISHAYPQGANLYFIFIGRMETIEEYLEYQQGILDNIQKHGAAMSHHHGIGKMTAPWLEGQLGKNELEIFRALKHHFDPANILNPGGTLALDLPDEQRRGVNSFKN